MSNDSLIRVSDANLLRHAVGACTSIRRSKWGYRNYFQTGGLHLGIERLVAAGLMVPFGKPSELTDGGQNYGVTPEGCDFIGLTPAQKKRALGGD